MRLFVDAIGLAGAVALPSATDAAQQASGAAKDAPRPDRLDALDFDNGAVSTNIDSYNLDLSERRARNVLAALPKQGINPSRLKVKGFGRAVPVVDNVTAQGRALNRRVEVSQLE